LPTVQVTKLIAYSHIGFFLKIKSSGSKLTAKSKPCKKSLKFFLNARNLAYSLHLVKMPTQVFAIFLELLEGADSLQLGWSGLSTLHHPKNPILGFHVWYETVPQGQFTWSVLFLSFWAFFSQLDFFP
jgi:hypothetical protein